MPLYHYNNSENRPDTVAPGIYECEVTAAEEKLSKAGNEMIELTLAILPSRATCFDYLLFIEKAAWKVDTFLKSAGHAPEAVGEADVRAEYLEGYIVKADIGIEPAEGNYPAKNVVLRYICPPTAKPIPPKKTPPEPITEAEKKHVPF